ncbi:MAG: lipoate--protein ligase family protein [Verrucomicrobia bacterium]|nr:lipoate--protein ligase family protein [Verrucomicrobiota bacterium]
MVIRPEIHLIHLENVPIFEQLQLEEALLRGSEENFCIINQGSPRAIVMGISGQPEQLINIEKVKQAHIPVIRRFSGGGTVIVDEDTLFVTFVFAKDLFGIPSFPEPILRWGEQIFQECWGIPHFQLRENDYCIGELKCGGNAQYIRKNRWLHHTSFLWDYSSENMKYLLLPDKRPKYRQDRTHDQFLTRLKIYGLDRRAFIQKLVAKIVAIGHVKPLYMTDLPIREPFRKSVQWVELR